LLEASHSVNVKTQQSRQNMPGRLLQLELNDVIESSKGRPTMVKLSHGEAAWIPQSGDTLQVLVTMLLCPQIYH